MNNRLIRCGNITRIIAYDRSRQRSNRKTTVVLPQQYTKMSALHKICWHILKHVKFNLSELLSTNNSLST
jgi:hypothetical protein